MIGANADTKVAGPPVKATGVHLGLNRPNTFCFVDLPDFGDPFNSLYRQVLIIAHRFSPEAMDISSRCPADAVTEIRF